MAGLALAALVCALLVAIFNPDLVRFRPFSVADFVQLIAPLLLVALFIERALEVFITSWRAGSAAKLQRNAEAARKRRAAADPPSDEEERLAEYKSRTQRIAFFAGSAIGVIVAALGIRILELLVDHAVFDTVSHTQRRLFRTADVLLTGAVLGGGSDGLHQLVSVFTNYMQSAAAWAKRRKPEAESAS